MNERTDSTHIVVSPPSTFSSIAGVTPDSLAHETGSFSCGFVVCMDGRTDGRMGSMDGWMDGWMDEGMGG